jgi:hypothetical protein
MKPKPYFKLLIALLPILLVINLMENKRHGNAHRAKKTSKNQRVNTGTSQTSSNDYIFFQSVSKYIYIPLIK